MLVGVDYHVGALIIRKSGLGARYSTFMIRNLQNSIGNYLGPYL